MGALTVDERPVRFESEQQVAEMASQQINDDDLETVRGSLQILEEIRLAAETPLDLRGDLPTELCRACLRMRKQMRKTVEAKSLYSGMVTDQSEDDTILQITVYLSLIDQIDQSLSLYKQRMVELHSKKVNELQESMQPKKEEKKLDDSSSESEEEKKEETPVAKPEAPSLPRGLKAPPKNTQHVLTGIKALNAKLGEQPQDDTLD